MWVCVCSYKLHRDNVFVFNSMPLTLGSCNLRRGLAAASFASFGFPPWSLMTVTSLSSICFVVCMRGKMCKPDVGGLPVRRPIR